MSNLLRNKKVRKNMKPEHPVQIEQIIRTKVPRRYIYALWILALIALAGVGLGAYSIVSMPDQVQKYISQHKSELKGDKGSIGPRGFSGSDGRDGANGSNGSNAGNSISCRSYDIGSSTYTNCY